MKAIKRCALFLLVSLLPACGQDLLEPPPLVGVTEPPGVNCPTGGVAYTSSSGVDYVCDGDPGPTGAAGASGSPGEAGSDGATGPQGPPGSAGARGTTGAAGESVAGVAEPAGANCPNGGIAYTSASGVDYVCNGELGPAGPAGATGLRGPTGLTGAAGDDGRDGPQGEPGVAGATGATGLRGFTGATGATGAVGATGATGATGLRGLTGATGATGALGPAGPAGALGPQGPIGLTGATGLQGPGGIMAFGYFYALMPDDNAATVAGGAAMDFPLDDGASVGIARNGSSASQFVLPTIGFYLVSWQASVAEAGQLVLGLDGVEQLGTVAGRATGTSQITNQVLLRTTAANSILTVRNPAGNSPALTVTPSAGGAQAVSASLVILQVR